MQWTVLSTIVFTTLVSVSASAEGRWLRGDLHNHTNDSDGDLPVAETLRSAEAVGLDFFALTDHDASMGGVPRTWTNPDYRSDKMILLYGVEWTTKRGHANIWSERPIDYTDIWKANRSFDPETASALAEAQGALFSINHPSAVRTEWWNYPVPSLVQSVEVWNAMYRFPTSSRWAVGQFWEGLLRSGRKMSAVGGSDTHRHSGLIASLYGHGNPTTWVYTESATAAGVLDAIRKGHVSISYAADAARVDLQADADGDGNYELMEGDSSSSIKGKVAFRINITPADSNSLTAFSEAEEVSQETVAALESGEKTIDEFLGTSENPGIQSEQLQSVGLFKNGILYKVWKIRGASLPIAFTDELKDGQKAYYRVELIGRPNVSAIKRLLLYGRMISMTNPIYFGF